MCPDDMKTVADLFCRTLVKKENPEKLKTEVIEFRKSFQELHFIRK
jgi:glycine/serine hydroxymethyltransferase